MRIKNHDKINICFFIGSFNTGGAERHVLQVIREINRDRYNPYLCVFKKAGAFLKEFNSLDIPTIEFGYNNRIINHIFKIFQFFKYIFFLKKNKIQIVHVHLVGCFTFALIGAMISQVKTKIITWHNIYDYSVINESTNSFIRKQRFIFRVKLGNYIADRIIAVSKKVKEKNCKFCHLSDNKVEVIYNGISPDLFIPIAQKYQNCYKERKSSFVIGKVGSLIPQKGDLYLLEAVARLKDEYPMFKLQLIGDGPLKSELENNSIRLGLENHVEFLGNRRDIHSLLVNLDIWIMTSTHEGFSIALLEAMAAGLPIIATDVGGNSEAIKHLESGIIIQPKNVDHIVEALIFLYMNPDEREKMGLAAYSRFIENFTHNKMMEKLDMLYSSNFNH